MPSLSSSSHRNSGYNSDGGADEGRYHTNAYGAATSTSSVARHESLEAHQPSASAPSSSHNTSTVVDFLYQAGKRYEQRLHLLRQEKVAAEMTHVTGKPTISPFAEEYYNNKVKLHQRMGQDGEETVQARLHRLHQRKLEREQEKLAKYKAQQEEKEMAEVTLKPRITDAAKRLEHRGSQADITAKWLAERREKQTRMHEVKLMREMAEVQPIPLISPYSAAIVQSGADSFYGGDGADLSRATNTDQSRREAAGNVTEYLLAREKERMMRLKALREAKDRLEGSTFKPTISTMASALQMGPVVDRLYTTKKSLLEQYIESSSGGEGSSGGEEGEGGGHSEYEEVMDEHGNFVVVRVERPKKMRKTAGGGGGAHNASVSRRTAKEAKAAFDRVFNPECTFRPYVSEASRQMVEQREQRLQAEAEVRRAKEEREGGVGGNASTLLNTTAVTEGNFSSARARGEAGNRRGGATNTSTAANPAHDPAYRKAYPDHTFRPTISATSRQLALKRQKAYDASKLLQQQHEGKGEEGDGASSPSSPGNNSGARRRRRAAGADKAPRSNTNAADNGDVQSVNRHLRLLGDDEDEDEDNYQSDASSSNWGDEGRDNRGRNHPNGTANATHRKRSSSLHSSVGFLSASQRGDNANNNATAADDGFTGKPQLCANSRRIAEEKRRRMKDELRSSFASMGSHNAASSNGPYDSGEEAEGSGYGGPYAVPGGGGAPSNTPIVDVDALSAHELMYHVSVKRREAKEYRVAEEKRARQEAEDAHCTFTPQRTFSTAGNMEKRRRAAQGQRGGAAAAALDEEGNLIPERRRLVMTAEAADAFARKNNQWLRRKEYALQSLKQSESSKDLEECTFRPRVHDQVPLPIGASANAPGVDNFLQRQRDARLRKEEEERRRAAVLHNPVDRRPIGGVTRPEPFHLGKDREKKRLQQSQQHQYSGMNASTMASGGSGYAARPLGGEYSQYYDPSRLGTSPPPPSTRGGPPPQPTPQQLTRKEWADIREQMLAPEQQQRAVGNGATPRQQEAPRQVTLHHYYADGGGANGRRADGNTNGSHLAEFSMHPVATAAPHANTTPRGGSGGPRSNTLSANYYGGSSINSVAAADGLFDKSPVDFVLNNHDNIVRQLQMRR